MKLFSLSLNLYFQTEGKVENKQTNKKEQKNLQLPAYYQKMVWNY